MNKTSIAIAFAFTLTTAFFAKLEAHDGHGHHHHGPNGGRLLLKASPDIEFKITKDRKVELYAINIKRKVVPMEQQQVKVTAGERSNPVRMTFTKVGEKLVSDIPFPPGDEFPVVVEIVVKPGGPTLVEKFTVDAEEFNHDHKKHKND